MLMEEFKPVVADFDISGAEILPDLEDLAVLIEEFFSGIDTNSCGNFF